MRADPWTAERVELLLRLWADGDTAQSIADWLGGVSRSAVMGKIFRLRRRAAGAAPAAAPPDRAASSDPAAAAARDSSRASSSALPFVRPAAPASRPRSKQSDPRRGAGAPERTKGKTLLELTNDSCRFPHGRPGTSTFFFCGAAGADLERGMPYCPGHARRAYRNRERATPAVVAERKPPATPPARPVRRYVWRPKVRHPAARWR